jgi:hypothetical protein
MRGTKVDNGIFYGTNKVTGETYLSKNGVDLMRGGKWYQSASDKTTTSILGGVIKIDNRPMWMQQQDLSMANVERYGSSTPSFGQITRDITGVGYGKNNSFGVDPATLAFNVATAGMGAGTKAAFNLIEKRAAASLAAKYGEQAAEILANRAAARAQFRDIVAYNRNQRFLRSSTIQRATRLERVEAALRDSNPGLAQAFGDRAYSLRAGRDIRGLMAGSETVGAGRRIAPSVGSGPRNVGARSFPYVDNPAAGSHHQFTPVSRAVPATLDANEWLSKFGQFADPYGRTGMDRLSGMYSAGVPKGGWMRSPNLRTRTPLPPRYDAAGRAVVNVGEMADGPYRDQVAQLLDDAGSFRNRAAWRLQSGRSTFPRPYGWDYEPSWAPESYQLRVFKSALKKGLIGPGRPAAPRRIR